MSRHPDACRACVREKHRVVGSELAQHRGQEFRTYRLDPWPFLDIVLQKFVERFRLREMLVEKVAVSLVTDARKQGGGGRLDVADKAKVNGRPAADVFGVLVDLDFLYTVAGKEFGERKVSAQQQHKIGFVNGAIRSAIAEKAGHPNRIGIVILQPLLAAERIADRRPQFGRQLEDLVAGVPAAIAPKNRYRPRTVDHFDQLVEIAVGGAKERRSGDGELV